MVKRIESYDRLVQYLPRLILSIKEVRLCSTQIRHKLEAKNIDIQKEIDELSEHAKFMSEIFSFIVTFGISYGHLFKYNFDSLDFRKLINISKRIDDTYSSVREKLILRQTNFPEIESMNEYVKLFDKILADLKTELK